MESYHRPMFGTCASCGQVVRNTPSAWHRHECTESGLLTMQGMRELRDRFTGFTGKVRTGGTGRRRVMESELECALIELHTDLTRWNEFAAYEEANG